MEISQKRIHGALKGRRCSAQPKRHHAILNLKVLGSIRFANVCVARFQYGNLRHLPRKPGMVPFCGLHRWPCYFIKSGRFPRVQFIMG